MFEALLAAVAVVIADLHSGQNIHFSKQDQVRLILHANHFGRQVAIARVVHKPAKTPGLSCSVNTENYTVLYMVPLVRNFYFIFFLCNLNKQLPSLYSPYFI